MTLLPSAMMPKIQEIPVREFRRNLSLYLRAAEVTKAKFIVMRHSVPIAKFGPPPKRRKTQKQLKQELLEAIREGEAQMERGEWYTAEEMDELLRIRKGLPLPKGRKKISIVFPKPPLKGSREK